MDALFVFGTLLDSDVLGTVLGSVPGLPTADPIRLRPARLDDHAALTLAGHNYPILRRLPGEQVHGGLIDGLQTEHWRRLVWFEGTRYDLDPCRVVADGQFIEARVFASENRELPTDRPWRLSDWQPVHKDEYLQRTRLWMQQLDAAAPLTDELVWDAPLDALQRRGLL